MKLTSLKSSPSICLEELYVSIIHKKSGLILFAYNVLTAVPTVNKTNLSRCFLRVSMFLSNVGPAETTTAVFPIYISLYLSNGISLNKFGIFCISIFNEG